MNLFVFDIETVPDVESGQRPDGLDDRYAAAAMSHLRAQRTGGSVSLPHYQHCILTSADCHRECRLVPEDPQKTGKPQLQEFLAARQIA